MNSKLLHKSLLLILIITLLFSLAACNEDEEAVDTSVSMYIGLGNTTGNYYSNLHDAILNNTGIDVKMVYSNTNDTTSAMAARIHNYDLPADIIITANYSNEDDQQNAFLDLAKYTNIPDLFKKATINDVSINGSVFQLPYTTRLIGIEYNKTLLEEMGWSLPNNYDEFVELKQKADEAGVNFAVSGGFATGHGFNYLFYVMGTDFISTTEGAEWLNNFQKGITNSDLFAEECEYFEKYVNSGLFGSFHNSDWIASKEYCETRSLFYYNITNDVASYNGPQYNSNGELVTETSEDEYASMPWISEDGTVNCFVKYNCMYVAVDKKIEGEEYSEKLKNVIKVLEYMASDEAIKLFTDMFPDGYASTKNFVIDESRLYYEYAESINKGFIIPWYYNDFDTDTIVNVGEKVNKYIEGKSETSLSDIIDELDRQNQLTLAGKSDSYLDITASFNYEECAKLEAKANALSLNSNNVDVNVSILPYTDDISKLPLQSSLGVVQEQLLEGIFPLSNVRMIINGKTANPVAIQMTGAEIKEFVNNGFDITEDYENYKEDGKVFPYIYVTKNGIELADNEVYTVAIPQNSMPSSVYQSFLDNGKVILDAEGNPIKGNMETGLTSLFDKYTSLSPSDNIW